MRPGFEVPGRLVQQRHRHVLYAARADFLFHQIFQRAPYPGERMRALRLVKQQTRFYNDPEAKFPSPWPLVAQALYMSNEFQYLD